MSNLPPLSALRAFEAAARHRSFTKAAQELFRTQSAISRHIRNLEEWVGKPLFFRNHRTVTLTPDGEAYMLELVDAFSRIEIATRKIQSAGNKNVLNIHAYATFVMRWLMPRLKSFQDKNPEIDLRLTASIRPVDFFHDEIHGAIRTGPIDWADDIRADVLFEYNLIPVASRELIEGARPIRQPEDLDHVTLLHSLPRPNDWNHYLSALGKGHIDTDRGMRFESSIMTYVAAQQGMGVALAQDFLVADDIRRGLLQQVFPHAVRSERTYFFLSSPRFAGRPELETFRSWLLEELDAGN
jgi:Transcriptional regulator